MKLIKDCIVRVVEDPQKAAAMMDDGWEKLGEPKKAKKDKASGAPEENATPAAPEENATPAAPEE